MWKSEQRLMLLDYKSSSKKKVGIKKKTKTTALQRKFLLLTTHKIEKYKNLTAEQKRIVTYWPYEGENENAKYGIPYEELYKNLVKIEGMVDALNAHEVSDDMLEKGAIAFVMSKLSVNDKTLLRQILQNQDAN